MRDSRDPITLEIQWQRLIAIMDEVDLATVRTSFSTIVGESRDFACIMTDTKGASLCQSSFSPPNFCVVLPRTARHLLARFQLDTLQDGDVLVTNDPWLGTGHLPDYVIMTPVFLNGTAIGFIGTVAHLADVGGHPGDIEASDVFTEGMRIPPSKLYIAGIPNSQLNEMIAANCRVPDLVLGDLGAIVGTHRVGARYLKEFLDDYSLPDLVDLADEIHGMSEAAIRKGILALPDGKWEFGLNIDGYIDLVHLHATVEVCGSDIFVDYTGTSNQVEHAAINCTFNTTFASTMYPFKCALVPRIPNNEGLFRPIHVTAPEGSILNCTDPSAVKARAKTTNNISQVLFGALWAIFGDHAQAGSGSIWPISFSGTAEGYGQFSVSMLPHGGRGSLKALDGMVPIAFPHNSAVTSTEVMEVKAPILVMKKALRMDSAGPGRRRGGLGQVIVIKSIAKVPIKLRLRPDKLTCAPPGLAGGQSGQVGEILLNSKKIERFPIIQFMPGEVCELFLPGGAGFGKVSDREPERVRCDVENGYISVQAALEQYGIQA